MPSDLPKFTFRPTAEDYDLLQALAAVPALAGADGSPPSLNAILRVSVRHLYATHFPAPKKTSGKKGKTA